MKLKIILRQMHEVTENLHKCVNSYGVPLKDGYLCHGKLCKSLDEIEWEERETLNIRTGEMEKQIVAKSPDDFRAIEFRHKNVDLKVAQSAKEYLADCIVNFCKKHEDGDLQTLFIGCILNLYYSSGLFDRNGCLGAEHIAEGVTNAVTAQYIGVMEKLMMKQVFAYFWNLCETNLFADESVNELLQLYVKEKKEEHLNLILTKINTDFENVRGFVKEIIKEWETFVLLEKKYGEANSSLLLELCSIHAGYQYANLLLCMDSVEEYIRSNGKQDGFTLYIDKLDEDIFNLGIGKEIPSAYECKMVDGKIQTTHPMTFSAFGYGFPYMKYFNWTESIHQLLSSEVENDAESKLAIDIKNEVCGYYPKYVGIQIDDAAKLALGLAKAKRDREKAIYEKKKVIQQFSHTYMNMRATSLYNIATELLKNEDKTYRNYGRKLLYEYSVKKNLTKNVEMLKLRFEDNEQELYERIADSILSKEDPNGVRIERLIDDALTRCMVTLVHDGGMSAKKLRAKFENYDWIEIRNSFENEVLLADHKNVREWFRQNMFELQCLISDQWKNVLFEGDSYAALLFSDIISELLINIFKYADKSRTVTLELKEEDGDMLLAAKNYVKDDDTEDRKQGGYGLEAETDAIRVMNEINGMKQSPMKTSIKNGIFTVELRVTGKLFKR